MLKGMAFILDADSLKIGAVTARESDLKSLGAIANDLGGPWITMESMMP